jgi:CBS domain-containing protein
MHVHELMVTNVLTCREGDSLERAAQLMWEGDVGAIPVVDADYRVIGMITDRDICMAAYTQGRPLWTIPVETAMSKTVVTCHADDNVSTAEMVMREAKVRRLPVVNHEGKLVGLLSLTDLAREATHERPGEDAPRPHDLAQTLARIVEPRRPANPTA